MRKDELESIEFLNINKLFDLKNKLVIPIYQRPYCWNKDSVISLLNDIYDSYQRYQDLNGEYKYRVGTIILYHNENNEYEIVDGQQRIITFVLLKMRLNDDFNLPIFKFNNNITKKHIKDNYMIIDNWFKSFKDEENIKNIIKDTLKNILEIAVITVSKIQIAFQLFDSQNARGMSLVPHDLLKAYHLRMIDDKKIDIKKIVTEFEEHKSIEIEELLNDYIYPIKNWMNKQYTRTFTKDDIKEFYGIDDKICDSYNYASRVNEISKLDDGFKFKLTDDYMAGVDFFKYIEYYFKLLNTIKDYIRDNFKNIYEMIENEEYNERIGFRYVKKLFYATVLAYYDKFYNFDEVVINKIYYWAFMLRVDLKNVTKDSINKYALGGNSYPSVYANNDKYTNSIPFFSIIKDAKDYHELYNIIIEINNKQDNEYWYKLMNLSGDENEK